MLTDSILQVKMSTRQEEKKAAERASEDFAILQSCKLNPLVWYHVAVSLIPAVCRLAYISWRRERELNCQLETIFCPFCPYTRKL